MAVDTTGQRALEQDDAGPRRLEDKLTASRNIRRRYEGQWMLNIAFLEGNQWIGFDGIRLFEPALEDWRAKIVDNRILPAVRTEIAKMTKTRPTWVGVPRDQSDDEINASRMREHAFEHYWGCLSMTPKLRSALTWRGSTGAGFWKVTWDRTVGDSVDVVRGVDGQVKKDRRGKPLHPSILEQLDPGMAEGLTADRVAMGDVRLDVRTPFEILPDPLATDDGLESAEWIGEEAVYSKSYLLRMYGHKALALNEDTNPSAGVSLLSRDGAGKAGYMGVKVCEYWSRPGVDASHPKGRHVVWAQDTVLLDEDNPYCALPYVMFRGNPVPGRFWPTCVVEQMIPQQVALNKLQSQIEENAERIGNPPLVYSAQSAEGAENWQGLPGEQIIFQDLGTPGAVPAFLQVPEMPAYIQNQGERIENSLREITRQNEASVGSVPSGVTAASAINLLQEANDTVLGPDIEDMEVTIQGAGRRLLRILKTYANDQRMMRISGDEGEFEFLAWTGDKLGDGETDEVQVGSGLPQSKAAKQAAIQQVLTLMIQNGQPVQQRDLRRVLRDFEVGGLEHFFAGLNKDEQQVRRENRQMYTMPPGQMFPLNDFDNHQAHVDGHQEEMKSDRWARLGHTSQGMASQAVFLEHVKAHKEAMAALATDMMGAPTDGPQGPAAPPGAPPAPGGPPLG